MKKRPIDEQIRKDPRVRKTQRPSVQKRETDRSRYGSETLDQAAARAGRPIGVQHGKARAPLHINALCCVRAIVSCSSPCHAT